MSTSTSDVIVIGAGAIGASCAFHLARRGLSVTVLDMFSGPAEGSTGRSFASVRAQWADDLNAEISWRSIQSYASFAAEHGHDVGYRPSGYLFLVPQSAWSTQLAAVAMQRRHGIPVEVLDPAAATEITSFDPDGIAGATWGPADGVVDPHAVASAYLTLARSCRAEVRFRHEVSAISATPGGAGWIVTAGDTVLHAPIVVNAAGGWAGQLAALAGLDVPVVHSRRNIYATASRSMGTQPPMTIDLASGFFLRSEGDRLLFGGRGAPERDGYSLDVDWEWMESALEVGVRRFPWLGHLPLDRSACWAGTYEVTPDSQCILGPHPAAPGWIDACGFSGHGLMQAPEAGRLVAEQACDGAITSLDLSPMSIERFADPERTATVGMVF